MKNKNIWLLPTDKPSRLVTIDGNLYFGKNEREMMSAEFLNIQSQNIYITSDEEIKEGDWCMSLCDDESYEEIYQCKKANLVPIEDRKIILTDNEDLIKDNVQSIDDEFLEWFVKNPSCEFVNIVPYDGYSRKIGSYSGYEIIIPKEEPKQYPIGGYAPGNYTCKCVTCEKKFVGDKRAVQCESCAILTTKEEPKKEMLEEASTNYANYNLQLHNAIKEAVKFGAKWQQEQNKNLYSEEDVIELNLRYLQELGKQQSENGHWINFKQWFELNKKK